jgi:hypothetical protein
VEDAGFGVQLSSRLLFLSILYRKALPFS